MTLSFLLVAHTIGPAITLHRKKNCFSAGPVEQMDGILADPSDATVC